VKSRECCFLLKDYDHCRDVRCCLTYTQECEPNALLAIPKRLDYIVLDDPTND
jgi:hypothetical protein